MKRVVPVILLISIVLTGFLSRVGYAVAAPIEEGVSVISSPAEQPQTLPTDGNISEESPPAQQVENPPTGGNVPEVSPPAEQAEIPSTDGNVPEVSPPAEQTETPSTDGNLPEELPPAEQTETPPADDNVPEESPPVENTEVIRLDGNFSDWINKPSCDSMDDDGGNTVKWYLSQEEQKLYIMTVLQRPHKNGKGKLNMQIKTNFGEYQMKIDYSTAHSENEEAVTVMTSMKAKNVEWSEGGEWGIVMPDGSIHIEYAVPLEDMLKGMEWGYLIQFRISNGAAYGTNNSWITVSSASTFPYVGVGVSIAACLILPAWMKRKKET